MVQGKTPEKALSLPDITQQIKVVFGDIPELSGSILWEEETIPLAVSHFDLQTKELVFVEKKDEPDAVDDYTGVRIDYSKYGERNFRRIACFMQTELNPKPILTNALVSYFLDEFEIRYGYSNYFGFAILAPQAQFQFDLDKLPEQIESICLQIADAKYPQRAVLAEASYHYDEHDQKYGGYFPLGSRPEIDHRQAELLKQPDGKKHLFKHGVGINIGAFSGVEFVDQRNWQIFGRTLVNSNTAAHLPETPYRFNVTRERGNYWGDGRLRFSRIDIENRSSWTLAVPEWTERQDFMCKLANTPQSLIENLRVQFMVKEKDSQH